MDKPKAIWFNKKIVAVVAILVIVGLAAYWVRHKMAEDKKEVLYKDHEHKVQHLV